MAVPTEDVYFKTRDDKGDAIVKMTLCQVDARFAVNAFPHQYAMTPDGHAPAPANAGGAEFANAAGQSGGRPSAVGGLGVKEVLRPAKGAHKASAAAA
ncbi:MAG: hypothetical protein KGJ45_11655 [Elusimicrobia bacterium]|nr:hypothetical protein [Elusimicrobiota bacterium]